VCVDFVVLFIIATLPSTSFCRYVKSIVKTPLIISETGKGIHVIFVGLPGVRPPLSFAPPPGPGLPPSVVPAPSLREPGPMVINVVRKFFVLFLL